MDQSLSSSSAQASTSSSTAAQRRRSSLSTAVYQAPEVLPSAQGAASSSSTSQAVPVNPKRGHRPLAFNSGEITISGGVAIFHLATERVVVCYDTKHRFYFLPKGRRDVDEDGRFGAEREGWEEVSSC